MIKICLEAYELFFMDTDAPHYRNLSRRVLPLQLMLLKSFSDFQYSDLIKMQAQLSSHGFMIIPSPTSDNAESG
jgi:hypothetical protein